VQAAWELGIPVVFSLYDLWTLCPLCSLLRPDGRLCTRYHGAHCVDCLHVLKKPLVLFRKSIFDRMLPKIDRFICLSQTVVGQLADYGIPRAKLATLPLPLFDSIQMAPDGRLDHSILFAGWVAATKGLHVLVEALPAVIGEYPDVRLSVIETGAVEPYKGDLTRRIADLGLTRHVHFLGKHSPVDVKHLLSRAGMVAVPEQWGIAWPIFLTEAMAYARPIVASRVGDIPRFIRDGRTGYLADRDSPEAFAHAILRIFRNGEHALALGRAARTFILEMCDEDRIATQLLSYYRFTETAA
ncbi:MAG TPA: glycosyltransferase, partial [Planctomycetota bacterium]|nr:glycosyltransferase [Planctomycetota bacterium]